MDLSNATLRELQCFSTFLKDVQPIINSKILHKSEFATDLRKKFTSYYYFKLLQKSLDLFDFEESCGDFCWKNTTVNFDGCSLEFLKIIRNFNYSIWDRGLLNTDVITRKINSLDFQIGYMLKTEEKNRWLKDLPEYL